MLPKHVTLPNQLGLGLNLSTKKTRRREFLDEMDRVVPWWLASTILPTRQQLSWPVEAGKSVDGLWVFFAVS